jgi:hypothetical protein
MIGALLIAATLAERMVIPSAKGPSRLDPDVSLLSAARKDLADLRLYDAAGHEVPYLVIPPASSKTIVVQEGRILDVAATKTTSGIEVDLGSLQTIDRLHLDGLPTPMLKRARIEGSGDRLHWTLLAAEVTIFDLPEQQLHNTNVDFEAGDYRYLRVTWDDRASARVTKVGSAYARLHQREAPPPPARVAAAFRRTASEPGKSRYRITLPGSHLPVAAIELRVANGNVFRDASITEPRLANGQVVPVPLGSAKLRRAERDGVVAEELAIPVSEPEGPDLELVVSDGSNPPLAIEGVMVRFAPLPWIYFESDDGSTLTARWGNAKATVPQYDLEAKRDAVAHTNPPPAKWSGELKKVEAKNGEGNALPLAGAPIDHGGFRYSRSIPSATGLVSLLLDADVLARSSLDDIRIAGESDRQVPYLLEHRDAPVTIKLDVPKRVGGERGTSVYRLALPYDSLPRGTTLVLTTTERVFDRTLTLRRPVDERHGREAETLTTISWRGTDQELAPPPLTFEVSLSGSRAVDLVVDEGDNAPLPITSAQLLLPSYALRFYHPGGALTLLYGNAQLGAPRYDLALLAPRLMGETAQELTLTSANPAEPPAAGTAARKWFWLALIAVVLILLAMLGRLVLRQPNEA